MQGPELLQTVLSLDPVQVLETATQVLGSLVLVGRGLEGVAKITPTTKDDAVVSKVNKGISKASNVLLKLGTLRSFLAASKQTPSK